ncbi:MAG: glycosyltransferase family 39 protein [bacterium]
MNSDFIRRLLGKIWADERLRLRVLLMGAFLIRLLPIIPFGNNITTPYRDQNTYYLLGRAIAEEGFFGATENPRGPYIEFRNRNPHPEGFYPTFHDSMAAAWDAEHRFYGIVEWGKPSSYWEPLYPLLTAGLWILFGDHFFFWRLIHVLIGTILVYFVYDIGKRAFRDPRVGFWAALITCFYPHILFYSWFLMAEGLLLFLLAAAFWAYFRLLEEPRWYWALLIGVGFAAFSLTRSFLILFFPVMLVLILLFVRSPKRWGLAAIAALGFIITFTPWVVRNYRVHDELVILSSRGGYNLWMRNNPYFIEDEWKAMGVAFSPEELAKLEKHDYLLGYPPFTPEQDELERNKILTAAGTAFIKANPGFFLKLCWVRFLWTIGYKGIGLGRVGNFVSLLTYGPVLLGFLFSLLIGWRHLQTMLPFWLVVSYFILFYTLFHEGLRYRVPVDPYMIILAVFSALWIYDRYLSKNGLTDARK